MIGDNGGMSLDITDELIARQTPEAQAIIRLLLAKLHELEARLNQNSSNSSKPPSSDPPSVKPAPPRLPSGKKKGGQPGHARHTRPELPPDTVVELRADTCGHCRTPLDGQDPEPLVHQVIELPPVRPLVTEYRRYRWRCPHCGHLACPPLPADAVGGYGPRVRAVCALLSGAYRIGKRGVAQLMRDLFGVPIGPAAVCKLQHQTTHALEPVVRNVHTHVAGKPANVDETGWREGKKRGWLWTAVTDTLSVFVVRLSRGRAVLAELIAGEPGVLTTDRYSAYNHLPEERRQVCWAHLRRDFQAMIDRTNAGSELGEELLAHANILLSHWKRVRDGTLTRRGFRRRYLGWVRREVQSLLSSGSACRCAKTAAVCRELLAIEPSLYTFAWEPGVEPTNNAAERVLRHAVCWRKTSYGTDSAKGSRFVERILTVVASCRQQGRDVLAFLTDAIQADRTATQPPSLIPAHASTP